MATILVGGIIWIGRQLFGPGTWGTAGNLVAAVLCAAAAAAAAWLGRHIIGRGLAAWWDRHHGPHARRRHDESLKAIDEKLDLLVAWHKPWGEN